MRISEAQLSEFAKRIELVGTKVLEGLHLSHRGGQGLEFHSASPYSEGEDARFIDWKRYASTDRFYVNRFAREEKTGWTIVVDRSESMRYGQKAVWARDFAATLVFLARVWADRWTLYPHEFAKTEEAFSALQTNDYGFLDLSKNFKEAEGMLTQSTKGDRIVIISDFFWDLAPLKRIVDHVHERGDAIHFVQVMDPREQDFKFNQRTLELSDLEGPQKLVVDTQSLRALYKATLAEHEQSLKALALGPSFHMVVLSDESAKKGKAMEDYLHRFFEEIQAL